MRLAIARALVALALLIPDSCFLIPAQAGALNPGAFTLGDFQIGAAGTYTNANGPLSDLAGLDAVTLQISLAGAAGGSTINVYIQTSIDQGQTWFDVANVAFTTTPGVALVNLSGLDKLTTPTAPSNLALTSNTVLDGPLGDRLQAVVVSTGAYTGNTLVSVRGVAR